VTEFTNNYVAENAKGGIKAVEGNAVIEWRSHIPPIFDIGVAG